MMELRKVISQLCESKKRNGRDFWRKHKVSKRKLHPWNNWKVSCEFYRRFLLSKFFQNGWVFHWGWSISLWLLGWNQRRLFKVHPVGCVPSKALFRVQCVYIYTYIYIKYLNSKPKVYMCHYINRGHTVTYLSKVCCLCWWALCIPELVVCLNTIWIAIDTDMNSASIITNADLQFQAKGDRGHIWVTSRVTNVGHASECIKRCAWRRHALQYFLCMIDIVDKSHWYVPELFMNDNQFHQQ